MLNFPSDYNLSLIKKRQYANELFRPFAMQENSNEMNENLFLNEITLPLWLSGVEPALWVLNWLCGSQNGTVVIELALWA